MVVSWQQEVTCGDLAACSQHSQPRPKSWSSAWEDYLDTQLPASSTHTGVWGAPQLRNPAASVAFTQHLLHMGHTWATTLAGRAAFDLGKLLDLPEPQLPRLDDRNRSTASQSCRQGLGWMPKPRVGLFQPPNPLQGLRPV